MARREGGRETVFVNSGSCFFFSFCSFLLSPSLTLSPSLSPFSFCSRALYFLLLGAPYRPPLIRRRAPTPQPTP